jgi:Flavodoxin domain
MAGPPSSILILCGTTEGQKRKIARFITDRLTKRGHAVKLIDAAEGELDPRPFGAAVIAASLHAGHYQPAVSITSAVTTTRSTSCQRRSCRCRYRRPVTTPTISTVSHDAWSSSCTPTPVALYARSWRSGRATLAIRAGCARPVAREVHRPLHLLRAAPEERSITILAKGNSPSGSQKLLKCHHGA